MAGQGVQSAQWCRIVKGYMLRLLTAPAPLCPTAGVRCAAQTRQQAFSSKDAKQPINTLWPWSPKQAPTLLPPSLEWATRQASQLSRHQQMSTDNKRRGATGERLTLLQIQISDLRSVAAAAGGRSSSNHHGICHRQFSQRCSVIDTVCQYMRCQSNDGYVSRQKTQQL